MMAMLGIISNYRVVGMRPPTVWLTALLTLFVASVTAKPKHGKGRSDNGVIWLTHVGGHGAIPIKIENIQAQYQDPNQVSNGYDKQIAMLNQLGLQRNSIRKVQIGGIPSSQVGSSQQTQTQNQDAEQISYGGLQKAILNQLGVQSNSFSGNHNYGKPIRKRKYSIPLKYHIGKIKQGQSNTHQGHKVSHGSGNQYAYLKQQGLQNGIVQNNAAATVYNSGQGGSTSASIQTKNNQGQYQTYVRPADQYVSLHPTGNQKNQINDKQGGDPYQSQGNVQYGSNGQNQPLKQEVIDNVAAVQNAYLSQIDNQNNNLGGIQYALPQLPHNGLPWYGIYPPNIQRTRSIQNPVQEQQLRQYINRPSYQSAHLNQNEQKSIGYYEVQNNQGYPGYIPSVPIHRKYPVGLTNQNQYNRQGSKHYLTEEANQYANLNQTSVQFNVIRGIKSEENQPNQTQHKTEPISPSNPSNPSTPSGSSPSQADNNQSVDVTQTLGNSQTVNQTGDRDGKLNAIVIQNGIQNSTVTANQVSPSSSPSSPPHKPSKTPSTPSRPSNPTGQSTPSGSSPSPASNNKNVAVNQDLQESQIVNQSGGPGSEIIVILEQNGIQKSTVTENQESPSSSPSSPPHKPSMTPSTPSGPSNPTGPSTPSGSSPSPASNNKNVAVNQDLQESQIVNQSGGPGSEIIAILEQNGIQNSTVTGNQVSPSSSQNSDSPPSSTPESDSPDRSSPDGGPSDSSAPDHSNPDTGSLQSRTPTSDSAAAPPSSAANSPPNKPPCPSNPSTPSGSSPSPASHNKNVAVNQDLQESQIVNQSGGPGSEIIAILEQNGIQNSTVTANQVNPSSSPSSPPHKPSKTPPTPSGPSNPTGPSTPSGSSPSPASNNKNVAVNQDLQESQIVNQSGGPGSEIIAILEQNGIQNSTVIGNQVSPSSSPSNPPHKPSKTPSTPSGPSNPTGPSAPSESSPSPASNNKNVAVNQDLQESQIVNQSGGPGSEIIAILEQNGIQNSTVTGNQVSPSSSQNSDSPPSSTPESDSPDRSSPDGGPSDSSAPDHSNPDTGSLQSRTPTSDSAAAPPSSAANSPPNKPPCPSNPSTPSGSSPSPASHNKNVAVNQDLKESQIVNQSGGPGSEIIAILEQNGIQNSTVTANQVSPSSSPSSPPHNPSKTPSTPSGPSNPNGPSTPLGSSPSPASNNKNVTVNQELQESQIVNQSGGPGSKIIAILEQTGIQNSTVTGNQVNPSSSPSSPPHKPSKTPPTPSGPSNPTGPSTPSGSSPSPASNNKNVAVNQDLQESQIVNQSGGPGSEIIAILEQNGIQNSTVIGNQVSPSSSPSNPPHKPSKTPSTPSGPSNSTGPSAPSESSPSPASNNKNVAVNQDLQESQIVNQSGGPGSEIIAILEQTGIQNSTVTGNQVSSSSSQNSDSPPSSTPESDSPDRSSPDGGPSDSSAPDHSNPDTGSLQSRTPTSDSAAAPPSSAAKSPPNKPPCPSNPSTPSGSSPSPASHNKNVAVNQDLKESQIVNQSGGPGSKIIAILEQNGIHNSTITANQVSPSSSPSSPPHNPSKTPSTPSGPSKPNGPSTPLGSSPSPASNNKNVAVNQELQESQIVNQSGGPGSKIIAILEQTGIQNLTVTGNQVNPSSSPSSPPHKPSKTPHTPSGPSNPTGPSTPSGSSPSPASNNKNVAVNQDLQESQIVNQSGGPGSEIIAILEQNGIQNSTVTGNQVNPSSSPSSPPHNPSKTPSTPSGPSNPNGPSTPLGSSPSPASNNKNVAVNQELQESQIVNQSGGSGSKIIAILEQTGIQNSTVTGNQVNPSSSPSSPPHKPSKIPPTPSGPSNPTGPSAPSESSPSPASNNKNVAVNQDLQESQIVNQSGGPGSEIIAILEQTGIQNSTVTGNQVSSSSSQNSDSPPSSTPKSDSPDRSSPDGGPSDSSAPDHSNPDTGSLQSRTPTCDSAAAPPSSAVKSPPNKPPCPSNPSTPSGSSPSPASHNKNVAVNQDLKESQIVNQSGGPGSKIIAILEQNGIHNSTVTANQVSPSSSPSSPPHNPSKTPSTPSGPSNPNGPSTPLGSSPSPASNNKNVAVNQELQESQIVNQSGGPGSKIIAILEQNGIQNSTVTGNQVNPSSSPSSPPHNPSKTPSTPSGPSNPNGPSTPLGSSPSPASNNKNVAVNQELQESQIVNQSGGPGSKIIAILEQTGIQNSTVTGNQVNPSSSPSSPPHKPSKTPPTPSGPSNPTGPSTPSGSSPSPASNNKNVAVNQDLQESQIVNQSGGPGSEIIAILEQTGIQNSTVIGNQVSPSSSPSNPPHKPSKTPSTPSGPSNPTGPSAPSESSPSPASNNKNVAVNQDLQQSQIVNQSGGPGSEIIAILEQNGIQNSTVTGNQVSPSSSQNSDSPPSSTPESDSPDRSSPDGGPSDSSAPDHSNPDTGSLQSRTPTSDSAAAPPSSAANSPPNKPPCPSNPSTPSGSSPSPASHNKDVAVNQDLKESQIVNQSGGPGSEIIAILEQNGIQNSTVTANQESPSSSPSSPPHNPSKTPSTPSGPSNPNGPSTPLGSSPSPASNNKNVTVNQELQESQIVNQSGGPGSKIIAILEQTGIQNSTVTGNQVNPSSSPSSPPHKPSKTPPTPSGPSNPTGPSTPSGSSPSPASNNKNVAVNQDLQESQIVNQSGGPGSEIIAILEQNGIQNSTVIGNQVSPSSSPSNPPHKPSKTPSTPSGPSNPTGPSAPSGSSPSPASNNKNVAVNQDLQESQIVNQSGGPGSEIIAILEQNGIQNSTVTGNQVSPSSSQNSDSPPSSTPESDSPDRSSPDGGPSDSSAPDHSNPDTGSLQSRTPTSDSAAAPPSSAANSPPNKPPCQSNPSTQSGSSPSPASHNKNVAVNQDLKESQIVNQSGGPGSEIIAILEQNGIQNSTITANQVSPSSSPSSPPHNPSKSPSTPSGPSNPNGPSTPLGSSPSPASNNKNVAVNQELQESQIVNQSGGPGSKIIAILEQTGIQNSTVTGNQVNPSSSPSSPPHKPSKTPPTPSGPSNPTGPSTPSGSSPSPASNNKNVAVNQDLQESQIVNQSGGPGSEIIAILEQNGIQNSTVIGNQVSPSSSPSNPPHKPSKTPSTPSGPSNPTGPSAPSESSPSPASNNKNVAVNQDLQESQIVNQSGGPGSEIIAILEQNGIQNSTVTGNQVSPSSSQNSDSPPSSTPESDSPDRSSPDGGPSDSSAPDHSNPDTGSLQSRTPTSDSAAAPPSSAANSPPNKPPCPSNPSTPSGSSPSPASHNKDVAVNQDLKESQIVNQSGGPGSEIIAILEQNGIQNSTVTANQVSPSSSPSSPPHNPSKTSCTPSGPSNPNGPSTPLGSSPSPASNNKNVAVNQELQESQIVNQSGGPGSKIIAILEQTGIQNSTVTGNQVNPSSSPSSPPHKPSKTPPTPSGPSNPTGPSTPSGSSPSPASNNKNVAVNQDLQESQIVNQSGGPGSEIIAILEQNGIQNSTVTANQVSPSSSPSSPPHKPSKTPPTPSGPSNPTGPSTPSGSSPSPASNNKNVAVNQDLQESQIVNQSGGPGSEIIAILEQNGIQNSTVTGNQVSPSSSQNSDSPPSSTPESDSPDRSSPDGGPSDSSAPDHSNPDTGSLQSRTPTSDSAAAPPSSAANSPPNKPPCPSNPSTPSGSSPSPASHNKDVAVNQDLKESQIVNQSGGPGSEIIAILEQNGIQNSTVTANQVSPSSSPSSPPHNPSKTSCTPSSPSNPNGPSTPLGSSPSPASNNKNVAVNQELQESQIVNQSGGPGSKIIAILEQTGIQNSTVTGNQVNPSSSPSSPPHKPSKTPPTPSGPSNPTGPSTPSGSSPSPASNNKNVAVNQDLQESQIVNQSGGPGSEIIAILEQNGIQNSTVTANQVSPSSSPSSPPHKPSKTPPTPSGPSNPTGPSTPSGSSPSPASNNKNVAVNQDLQESQIVNQSGGPGSEIIAILEQNGIQNSTVTGNQVSPSSSQNSDSPPSSTPESDSPDRSSPDGGPSDSSAPDHSNPDTGSLQSRTPTSDSAAAPPSSAANSPPNKPPCPSNPSTPSGSSPSPASHNKDVAVNQDLKESQIVNQSGGPGSEIIAILEQNGIQNSTVTANQVSPSRSPSSPPHNPSKTSCTPSGPSNPNGPSTPLGSSPSPASNNKNVAVNQELQESQIVHQSGGPGSKIIAILEQTGIQNSTVTGNQVNPSSSPSSPPHKPSKTPPTPSGPSNPTGPSTPSGSSPSPASNNKNVAVNQDLQESQIVNQSGGPGSEIIAILEQNGIQNSTVIGNQVSPSSSPSNPPHKPSKTPSTPSGPSNPTGPSAPSESSPSPASNNKNVAVNQDLQESQIVNQSGGPGSEIIAILEQNGIQNSTVTGNQVSPSSSQNSDLPPSSTPESDSPDRSSPDGGPSDSSAPDYSNPDTGSLQSRTPTSDSAAAPPSSAANSPPNKPPCPSNPSTPSGSSPSPASHNKNVAVNQDLKESQIVNQSGGPGSEIIAILEENGIQNSTVTANQVSPSSSPSSPPHNPSKTPSTPSGPSNPTGPSAPSGSSPSPASNNKIVAVDQDLQESQIVNQSGGPGSKIIAILEQNGIQNSTVTGNQVSPSSSPSNPPLKPSKTPSAPSGPSNPTGPSTPSGSSPNPASNNKNVVVNQDLQESQIVNQSGGPGSKIIAILEQNGIQNSTVTGNQVSPSSSPSNPPHKPSKTSSTPSGPSNPTGPSTPSGSSPSPASNNKNVVVNQDLQESQIVNQSGGPGSEIIVILEQNGIQNSTVTGNQVSPSSSPSSPPYKPSKTPSTPSDPSNPTGPSTPSGSSPSPASNNKNVAVNQDLQESQIVNQSGGPGSEIIAILEQNGIQVSDDSGYQIASSADDGNSNPSDVIIEELTPVEVDEEVVPSGPSNPTGPSTPSGSSPNPASNNKIVAVDQDLQESQIVNQSGGPGSKIIAILEQNGIQNSTVTGNQVSPSSSPSNPPLKPSKTPSAPSGPSNPTGPSTPSGSSPNPASNNKNVVVNQDLQESQIVNQSGGPGSKIIAILEQNGIQNSTVTGNQVSPSSSPSNPPHKPSKTPSTPSGPSNPTGPSTPSGSSPSPASNNKNVVVNQDLQESQIVNQSGGPGSEIIVILEQNGIQNSTVTGNHLSPSSSPSSPPYKPSKTPSTPSDPSNPTGPSTPSGSSPSPASNNKNVAVNQDLQESQIVNQSGGPGSEIIAILEQNGIQVSDDSGYHIASSADDGNSNPSDVIIEELIPVEVDEEVVPSGPSNPTGPSTPSGSSPNPASNNKNVVVNQDLLESQIVNQSGGPGSEIIVILEQNGIQNSTVTGNQVSPSSSPSSPPYKPSKTPSTPSDPSNPTGPSTPSGSSPSPASNNKNVAVNQDLQESQIVNQSGGPGSEIIAILEQNGIQVSDDSGYQIASSADDGNSNPSDVIIEELIPVEVDEEVVPSGPSNPTGPSTPSGSSPNPASNNKNVVVNQDLQESQIVNQSGGPGSKIIAILEQNGIQNSTVTGNQVSPSSSPSSPPHKPSKTPSTPSGPSNPTGPSTPSGSSPSPASNNKNVVVNQDLQESQIVNQSGGPGSEIIAILEQNGIQVSDDSGYQIASSADDGNSNPSDVIIEELIPVEVDEEVVPIEILEPYPLPLIPQPYQPYPQPGPSLPYPPYPVPPGCFPSPMPPYLPWASWPWNVLLGGYPPNYPGMYPFPPPPGSVQTGLSYQNQNLGQVVSETANGPAIQSANANDNEIGYQNSGISQAHHQLSQII